MATVKYSKGSTPVKIKEGMLFSGGDGAMYIIARGSVRDYALINLSTGYIHGFEEFHKFSCWLASNMRGGALTPLKPGDSVTLIQD